MVVVSGASAPGVAPVGGVAPEIIDDGEKKKKKRPVVPTFPVWSREDVENWSKCASDKRTSVYALRQCVDYVLHFAGFPDVVKLPDDFLGNSKNMPYKFVEQLAEKIVPTDMVEDIGEESAIPLSFTAPPAEAYGLTHKKTRDNARKALGNWFSQLSQSLKPFDLCDTGLLPHLCLWLEGLYSSQYLCLRHTATVVAGHVLLDVTDIVSELQTQLEISVRQHEAESSVKRRQYLKEDIANTEKVAKALLQSRSHLLADFKKTRCRDHTPAVRAEAHSYLYKLISKDLSLFDEEVAALVHWALSDASGNARLAALVAIEGWLLAYDGDRKKLDQWEAREAARIQRWQIEQNRKIQVATTEEERSQLQQEVPTVEQPAFLRSWSDDAAREFFEQFLQNNAKYFHERCSDTDERVSVQGIKLCSLVCSVGDEYFNDDEFDSIVTLVLCAPTKKVRLQAAQFVNQHVFSDPGIEDMDSLPPWAADGVGNLGGSENVDNASKKQLQLETRLLMFLEYICMYARDAKSIVIQAVSAFWGRASCLTAWKVMVSLLFLCEDGALGGDDGGGGGSNNAVEPLPVGKKVALLTMMEASITLLQKEHAQAVAGQNEAEKNQTKADLALACAQVLPKMGQLFKLMSSERYGKLVLSNIFEMLLRFMLENSQTVSRQPLNPVSTICEALEQVLDESGAGAQGSPALLYGNCCRCYRHVAELDQEGKSALMVWLNSKRGQMKGTLEHLCVVPTGWVPKLSADPDEELLTGNFGSGAVAAQRTRRREMDVPRNESRQDAWIRKRLLDPLVAAAKPSSEEEGKEDNDKEPSSAGAVAAEGKQQEENEDADEPGGGNNGESAIIFTQLLERAVEINSNIGTFVSKDMLEHFLAILRFDEANRLPRNLLVPLIKLCHHSILSYVSSLACRKLEADERQEKPSGVSDKTALNNVKNPALFWRDLDKIAQKSIQASEGADQVAAAADNKKSSKAPAAFVVNCRRKNEYYTGASDARVKRLAFDILEELNCGGFVPDRDVEDCEEPQMSAQVSTWFAGEEKAVAKCFFDFREACVSHILSQHRDPWVKFLCMAIYFDGLQTQGAMIEVMRLDETLFTADFTSGFYDKKTLRLDGRKVHERIGEMYVYWLSQKGRLDAQAKVPQVDEQEIASVKNPVLIYQKHEVMIWTYLLNLFSDLRRCVATAEDQEGRQRIVQELVTSDKIIYPSSDMLNRYIPVKESSLRSVQRALVPEDSLSAIEFCFSKACMVPVAALGEPKEIEATGLDPYPKQRTKTTFSKI
ncbi:unnamed protein product [Amoebophrya sp. A25]|nr:unnamed protein product [Amoebophrya sp. A25]|eukprot:GSA25T00017175001.1